MNELPFPIPVEELLAHETFLRGLAKGLLFDDSQVDDAIQQSWMAAIQSPPRRMDNLRAWLGTVLRNKALRMRRDERARTARDHAGARPEATESVETFLGRETLRREVIDAVMTLEEPYRQIILQRYFDGLAPRKIAQAAGIPVETVYAHNRKALEMLRERLDRNHGGDRKAWALGLIPLAAQSAKAFSMKAGLLLAAGLLVLLIPAVLLFRSQSDASTASETTSQIGAPATAWGFSSVTPATLEPSAGREPVPARQPAPGSVVQDSSKEETNPAKRGIPILRGRLLDQDRRPLPAELPWPWSWAEGKGISYFRLLALVEAPSSKIGRDNFPASLLESRPQPKSEKDSQFFTIQKVPESRIRRAVRITDYNEEDGSFQVELDEKSCGAKACVTFVSAQGLEHSADVELGDGHEVEILVDWEKISGPWNFAEFETIAEGSGEKLLVADWKLRSDEIRPPTSNIGFSSESLRVDEALGISYPGHFGVAWREPIAGESLLFVPGYERAVVPASVFTKASSERRILFVPQSSLRVSVRAHDKPIRSAGLRIEDLAGKLIWGEEQEAADGVYLISGLPSGAFRAIAWCLESECYEESWLQGSVEVNCVAGQETQAEISLQKAAKNGYSFVVVGDGGPSKTYRVEVYDGETLLPLPAPVTIEGRSSATMGLTGSMNPGRYRAIFYVDDQKVAEKFFEVMAEGISTVEFP